MFYLFFGVGIGAALSGAIYCGATAATGPNES